MIGYEKPFSAVLDESTEAVGKNLARGRDRAFCKAVLKHSRLCKTMLLEIGNLVRTECANLSSRKTPSFNHNKGKTDIGCFTWDAIALDLQTRAPTFHAVLVAAADRQWTKKAESSQKCVPACSWHGCCHFAEVTKQADISCSDNDFTSPECWTC